MQTGFWWILLAVMIYGALHSIFAAHSTKKRVEQWIGAENYHRYYRLFFSLQGFLLFLPLLALVLILPDQLIYRIPHPWVWLTLLIQLATFGLLLHSITQTGALHFMGWAQALNSTEAMHQSSLVERGLYRFVRHPIYTCTFVIIWLIPVMSWNVLALVSGITIYTIIGAFFEERKLLAEFGDEYLAYKRKTPFLIPGLRKNSGNSA